ncbi:MAG TPA: PglZ domain-containing protein [bacterium]|nr:PglZ domain-containing protein [bacterium]
MAAEIDNVNARKKLEQWVVDKLEPLKDERSIVLRDPQRMIQRDARAVDGWAADSRFNALICTGNFRFRIWYENIKDDRSVNLLLVDQTRDSDASRRNAPPPVFYPDLLALTKPKARLTVTLRDFLVHATDDRRWPSLVNERNLSRIVLENLGGILLAHSQLRRVHDERFSDTDLYKIILGAMLGIDPFRNPSELEVRRLCVEQHARFEEVKRLLPTEVTDVLMRSIGQTKAPFCWFVKYDDHELVMRAFTLALLLHQYDDLDPKLLLANFDPALKELREIDPQTLDRAGKEFLESDPDRLAEDIRKLEEFLQEDAERINLLFNDLLKILDRKNAIRVLKAEKLSPLVRTTALAVLLADLLSNRNPDLHLEAINLLDQEEAEAEVSTDLFNANQEPLSLALRRPTEEWALLKETYRLTHQTLKLADRAKHEAHQLVVAKTENLTFQQFDQAWRIDGLSKLDFYLSDIAGTLRLEQAKPMRDQLLWEDFRKLWVKAREQFEILQDQVRKDLARFQEKFQDLYVANYPRWIKDDNAPVVFTHQFVSRLLKPHWDPQKNQKAYLLIFDGMRIDAWQEFLLPLFKERFDVIEERPGSALLPTETNLTRKAISAGCLPTEFISKSESALLEAAVKKQIGYNLQLTVEKDDDDAAAGIAIRYTSPLLTVVIFNFTDKNLHNNPQDLSFIYRQTVQAIIARDVRSVMRQIEDDALIFVTSDHGFVPTGDQRLRISETEILDNWDVNHLVARLQCELAGRFRHSVVHFTPTQLSVPAQTTGKNPHPFSHFAFPRPGFTLQRPRYPGDPDRYTHGGLSPAECFIPMVVLGPKPDRGLPIRIDSFEVQGSLMEGEDATLELTVVGAPRDVKLLIDADRAGLKGRTELFFGGQKTYRINWRLPRIDEPTAEEIENAAVVYPVSVTVKYQYKGKPYQTSKATNARILLDRNRLRRPGASKIDAVLGMMPRRIKE